METDTMDTSDKNESISTNVAAPLSLSFLAQNCLPKHSTVSEVKAHLPHQHEAINNCEYMDSSGSKHGMNIGGSGPSGDESSGQTDINTDMDTEATSRRRFVYKYDPCCNRA